MSWKKSLMCIVIIGAILCMIASFVKGDYVVGTLSGLTVIVPAVIWYSDDKENQIRDRQLADQERDLRIHDQVLDAKADRDQGFFDI